jgi:hypothetical protein
MPVMPHDPAVPLWVLSTVPKSRSREGYRAQIWLYAIRAGVLMALSAALLYSMRTVNQQLPPWLIFFILGIRSLIEIVRSILARRWLDRHQAWAQLETLKWAEANDELPRAWMWGGTAVICGLIFLVWLFWSR